MRTYDLADIFGSYKKFQAKKFSNKEKNILKEYLTINCGFKKHRMLRLLNDEFQSDNLTWIEWFNWYYQGVSFSEFPAWLEEEKERLGRSEIKLVSYPDLFNLGWEIKDVVKSSIDISSQGIENYIPTDNELEHWVTLRSQNSDLFTGALLAGELVGQFGFIKITDEEYQQMSAGNLSEDKLAGFYQDSKEDVFLYIPSVVIKPALQKRTLLMGMLQHLFHQFNNSATRSQVKGFIAIAYTSQGEKLCQQFNLTYKPSPIKDHKIYRGTTSELMKSKLFTKFFGENLSSNSE